MSDAFLPGNGFDTYETQDKVLVSMDGSVDCGVVVRRASAWPGLWCSWPLTKARGPQPHGRLPRLLALSASC